MSIHVPPPLRAARPSRREALDMLLILLRQPPLVRRFILAGMPRTAVRAILDEWWWQAHGGQIEPPKCDGGLDWRVWAIVAARGFGKTRAGAEWVWARAREARSGTVTGDCPIRIALVAATIDEAVRVMVEGESGILATARCDEVPRFFPSRNLLHFPGGAEAHIFSAEKPDKLRGPQHHFAWCDELAKWPNADKTWDNLMLGLRLGDNPRTIVTTTPKPMPLLKRILALPRCTRTDGRTADNVHLPADFVEAVTEMYGGTRLGRQELEGLLLDEFEDALWSRELIEKARARVTGETPPLEGEGIGEGWPMRPAEPFRGVHPHPDPPPSRGREYRRIVLGLDPPASTGGDSCGIVVCGKDENGIAWVLADLTAAGLSPEAWARRVVAAAAEYGASRVVAEKNQGGDMIASVLRAVDADLPVRLVAATTSKAARAEPIALRFETGRARLAGFFPELEDQLCALTWSGYQGPGSPDRADAMVWAMTELFGKEPAMPRIRGL
jgi:phage terminase large subunit-like protein